MVEEKFYSVDEAATRLALVRAEVYRRVVDGLLKGEKRDRRLCFSESELVRYEGVVSAEGQVLREALSDALTLFATRLQVHAAVVATTADGETETGGEGPAANEDAPAPTTDGAADAVLEKDTPSAATDDQIAELGDLILRDALLGAVPDLFLDPLHDGARLLSGPEGNRRELAHFPGVLATPLREWFKKTAALPAEGTVREAVGQREVEDTQYQFRLQTVPTLLGELVHLHFFLDRDEGGMETLGYTEDQVAVLRQLLSGRPGILLLAGAAGPGLDSHRLGLACLLATEGRLVVALDRRTQYRDERLVQLELASGADADTTGLWRTALAMQPNALCFEMVNLPEERRYLLEGAGAGALVIAQMSASSALSALAALVADEVDRRAIANSLLGVVESRAFRRLCPHCRVLRSATDAEIGQTGLDSGAQIAEPQACDRCGDGYLGRRLLFGVWPWDETLAAWLSASEQASEPVPMPPAGLALEQAARQAVLTGEIYWAEALPHLTAGARQGADAVS